MRRPLAYRTVILAVALIAVAVALLAAALNVAAPALSPAARTSQVQHTVALGGQTIRVTVADTEAARELGLGGRTGLAPDEGMLFVFPRDGIYAFWMKDMKFSIDILWLASDGTVVYMAQNVSPDTYPQAFRPATPVRYVLELPAGFSKRYNVQIGARARF